MKLLRWMHHKLQQINIDPCKDVAIGSVFILRTPFHSCDNPIRLQFSKNCVPVTSSSVLIHFHYAVSGNSCACLAVQPSLSDQQSGPKQSFGSRPLNQTQKECQKSFSEYDLEQESPTEISDLFQGFLTIGTLGTESISQGLETPTFSTTLEYIIEKETEVKDKNAKLIKDQLEKFLETEVKNEKCNESSGNSHVSTTTLSSKEVEGTHIKVGEKLEVGPLQGNLSGSAIELPESKLEAKKEKVSLGELFRRSKTAEELSIMKCEKAEQQGKRTRKSPMRLMKKMLKKLHASPRSSNQNDADDSVSITRKLHKVPGMFHKKIHPESTVAAKGSNETHTHEIKNTPYYFGYVDGDVKFLDEDIKRFPQVYVSNEGFHGHKANSNLPQNGLSSKGIGGNKERWVKTDPHYLVLEL